MARFPGLVSDQNVFTANFTIRLIVTEGKRWIWEETKAYVSDNE